jgi:hypothetical protein
MTECVKHRTSFQNQLREVRSTRLSTDMYILLFQDPSFSTFQHRARIQTGRFVGKKSFPSVDYLTGGLGFGGGGLGIPYRKCSPVALRFQRTLCIIGHTSLMAPCLYRGHTPTQQPHLQHSSGYNTIGGFPFVGLGKRMSMTHTDTHKGLGKPMQPLQTFGSYTTILLGVTWLGSI